MHGNTIIGVIIVVILQNKSQKIHLLHNVLFCPVFFENDDKTFDIWDIETFNYFKKKDSYMKNCQYELIFTLIVC